MLPSLKTTKKELVVILYFAMSMGILAKILFDDGNATTTFRDIMSFPKYPSIHIFSYEFKIKVFFCSYIRYAFEVGMYLNIILLCFRCIQLNKSISEYLVSLIGL